MLWIIPLDQLYLKQVYAIMAIFPLHIKDQGDYGVSFVAPPKSPFTPKLHQPWRILHRYVHLG